MGNDPPVACATAAYARRAPFVCKQTFPPFRGGITLCQKGLGVETSRFCGEITFKNKGARGRNVSLLQMKEKSQIFTKTTQ